ncbi:MAG: dihydrolipoyl dehydrogenase [Rickettsia sp.]|nr:dihydrolipoyl dehydrogenase [Rickettsia sp.]
MQYDIAIIGAGPGGYVAAIRASQLGQNVILIEKNKVGGVCLNQGCIPTKSLLHSGEIFYKSKNFADYGVEFSDITFNITKAVNKARSISEKLVRGIKGLVKKHKINLLYGQSSFESKNKLIVEKEDGSSEFVYAKNIIIATGARPKNIKNIQADHNKIWDYTDALFPKILPKTMVIIGSGAIGIEFASFYNHIGVDVTVLESREEILSSEDSEIVRIAKYSFEKRGIKFFTNVKIEEASYNSNKDIEIEFFCYNGEKKKLKSEILLLATGVKANVEKLALDKVKLELSGDIIKTNDNMETNVSNIFAIGDVTKPPWLAHKASHEGIIAAETIANYKSHKMDYNNIPFCIYSSPEIARIGLTEKEALDIGHKINIGKFPFNANGKAMILGDSDGMIKTIFDKDTGELLGAHMIGSYVTELISGFSIAKTSELTEEELAKTIFSHPTLSEMMHESSLSALKKAIHV